MDTGERGGKEAVLAHTRGSYLLSKALSTTQSFLYYAHILCNSGLFRLEAPKTLVVSS